MNDVETQMIACRVSFQFFRGIVIELLLKFD